MSDAHKAVFLSYASQDAGAARKICDALRAAGVEVWFDQSELRGGDAWDQKIRKQIKECALFVPVISASTQARREGYFRREWKQAAARTHDIADGTPFLLPVVIDETRDAGALVPEEFFAVQWTRLDAAGPFNAFCERVGRLLSNEPGGETHLRFDGPQPRRETSVRSATSRRWLVPLAVAAAVMLGLVIARPWGRRSPAAASPRAPISEARQLVARVYATKVESAHMTRAMFDAAESLCQRAAALDPADAEVWAAWSYLESWRIQQFERKPGERFESARTKAARAMTYAPDSFNARLAQAAYLVLVAPKNNLSRAESMLTQLLKEEPTHPGALRTMIHVIRSLDRGEEVPALLDRLERVSGYEATAYSIRAWTFRLRGDNAAAKTAAEKSVALGGGSPALLLQILLCLDWDGDLDRARQLVEQMPPEHLLEDDGAVAAARVFEWRREPERVLQILRAINRDWLLANSYTGPKPLLTGRAYLANHKPDAAKTEFQFALRLVNQRLGEAPGDAALLGLKVELLDYLGDEAGAAESRRLLAQVSGSTRATQRMTAAEWIADLASQLGTVRRRDQTLPGITAASLRLSPDYDELRSEPAFAELLRRAEADPRSSPRTPVPASTSAAADTKSVAVLAFANLSEDKDNEYFSDGISEELLNVLAKVPGLKVSARTSAFSFKGKGVAIPEIARQLGVAYVVEGSVRKAGNRVRITAQLIKANDGFHVWSDNFDRELKDIFAVQDEIAGLIATKLSLSLGASPEAKRPVNPEVFRLYLEARQAWNLRNETGYQRAESLLNQALVLDPNFARAHAALSDVWLTRGQDNGTVGSRSQRDGLQMTRLTQAAERAIELEPNSAEARASLGNAFKHQWKLEEAEREFRAAIDLNPNYASAHQWLGRALMDMGRFEAGIAELQRAVELDPLSSRIADNLSDGWLRIGRAAEALQLADRALSLQPDSDQALVFRAMALAHLGRSAEAIQATTGIDRSRWANFIAYVLAVAGDHRGAERELRSSEGRTDARVDESERAGAWFALGRKTEGLAALVPEAIKINNVSRLYSFPVFDPMRDDPRFLQAIADMGVTEYYRRAQAWRASNQRTDKNGAPSVGSAKEGGAK